MPLKDIWLPGGSEHFHEVWRNREYEVFVRHLEPDDGRGGPLHLSIRRLDRESVYDWRHKQSIKRDRRPDREALELFPGRTSARRRPANQTHLWVLPRGIEVPFGFEGGHAAYDT